MIVRVLVGLLLALSVADARVDFNYSQIFDEFDFAGQPSVSVVGLCADGCHIYASITEESRRAAQNLLIQTSRGFTSIAALADQRNATNGQKIPLEINNAASLTITNGNSGLAAGPLVLYIVNKAAPNFAGAEVYEAEGFIRPAGMLYALTVMSARPFTLRQKRLEGPAAGAPAGVLSHLTGFDALMYYSDTCPNLYYLIYGPFPGFTMEVNGPIISLLYDLNQFRFPAGELSATIGITNKLQLERAGFFNSPGFHGCVGKQVYRSSLYDTASRERVELTNATPESIIVDVVTNADLEHAVTFTEGEAGAINRVHDTFETSPVSLTFKTSNLTVTWAPESAVTTHYMIRYNSTMIPTI